MFTTKFTGTVFNNPFFHQTCNTKTTLDQLKKLNTWYASGPHGNSWKQQEIDVHEWKKQLKRTKQKQICVCFTFTISSINKWCPPQIVSPISNSEFTIFKRICIYHDYFQMANWEKYLEKISEKNWWTHLMNSLCGS